jgi:hypothetical protein
VASGSFLISFDTFFQVSSWQANKSDCRGVRHNASSASASAGMG